MYPENPLRPFEIEHKLSLMQPVIKSGISPNILKTTALEAISTLYPQENWLDIFKNKSKLNENENTSAGIY